MKGQATLFSSKSDEWETPQALFDELHKEFDFFLDVCATKENAKCDYFYDQRIDGLKSLWHAEQNRWCNPPYSNIGAWVEKAATSEGLTVMLIPARTDTKWFHAHIYQKPNVEIRFLKGRLKFGDSKNSAPFPSMVVIFRNS